MCVLIHLSALNHLLSPSQSQPRSFTEKARWVGPRWTTAQTSGGLPHPESSGWGAEGRRFRTDMWVGCWKWRSGQQSPPQALRLGHGSKGDSEHPKFVVFLQMRWHNRVTFRMRNTETKWQWLGLWLYKVVSYLPKHFDCHTDSVVYL